MNIGDIGLFIPAIVAAAVIALMSRRMLRPRRVSTGTLWIAPLFVLAGAVATLASRPTPTLAHGAGLMAALALGGAVGWARARLVKIAIDPATGGVTQRGTPYGLVLLVGFFASRSVVSILTIKHPEWGIDLRRATDILLLFAFGLLTGYAAELRWAVARARRPT